ncbi:Fucose 4-O-acetylase [Tritonibacter multivorans]|uniref:Fucose 4-O-acetylase n=1 Tax=Tritonibacter multivorans TaxID=928856 RepID=A0A0P1GWE0_9RHOB|nr:hypothetical protein [Tritonibacter multivorans]MDA7419894.1 glycosyltransferase family 2 protein [Tritonibacter multivorans]CUH79267.1 Fucose 4-O-acetylase [Tritonibacter multivorans]SFC12784.1 hypothetical protein SAMN04488049_101406 [Tritonibacter multivorans]
MLTEAFRAFKHRRRVRRALKEIESRQVTPRPHGLDRPLVVTLTSYPARFETLAPTLRGLLRQNVAADDTQLFLTEKDAKQLPQDVLELQSQGLTLKLCEDLRSYKKLVPALRENPDRFLVTADDDAYYEADWLADLVAGAKNTPGCVVAHRCHRVQRLNDGTVAAYGTWSHNIDAPARSADLCATGVSGILYPPASLDSRVTDAALFQQLCPQSDDLWFYWMARLAGTEVAKIGGRRRILEWPGSQTVSLRSDNSRADGNDAAIAALNDVFGPP